MSRKNEKYLYQENKLAYDLVLVALAVNTAVVIMLLKSMAVNYLIGNVIMFNIVLSLFGFLLAIKVRKYFKNWAYIAIALSFVQLTRIWTLPGFENKSLVMLLDALLVGSAVLFFISGLITLKRAARRASNIS